MSVCIQIIIFLVGAVQVEAAWSEHPEFENPPQGTEPIRDKELIDTEVNTSSSYIKNRTPEGVLLQGFCRDRLQSKECFNVDCFPCSKHACAMGTCCVEELTQATKDAGKHTGCMENQVAGIVRCPESWPQDYVREACENGTGKFTTDEPVSYLEENLTFRNKHCAICHGVHHTRYVPWTHSVTCKHFQYVYMARFMDQLLEKASDPRSTCRIGLVPPDRLMTQPCPPDEKKWYSSDLVKSCNVTGNWARYDAEVDDSCQRYQALSLRIYHQNSFQLFQNLYCAECNGVRAHIEPCPMRPMSRPTTARGRSRSHRPRQTTPPLTLLLGVRDFPQQQQQQQQQPLSSNKTCSHGIWLDLSNQCHNVSCTEGKIFSTENGTCSTAVSMIRGLAYNLYVTLIPKGSLSLLNSEGTWDKFQQRFKQTLQAKLEPSEFGEIRVSPLFTVDSSGSIKLQEIVMKGWVLSSSRISRDVLENQWVRNMLSDWDITEEENSNVTFTFVYAGQPLKELHSSHTPTSLTFYSIWSKQSRFSLKEFPSHLKIPLTPVLTCPAVRFSESEFDAVPTPGISSLMEVYLSFDGASLKLPGISHAEVRNQTLYVCQSVLKELSGHRVWCSSLMMMDFPFWEYVLNMTVIPLSIFSLFIILVVYAILPVLRTLPGLNMMGICSSLMLAQTSVLLVVHQPVEGAGCITLGILVHFFWLSTFCWTFVSSLHMFQTFSSSNTPNTKKERILRSWLKNVVLTVIFPVGVIALVIVVSFVTSEGQSIGYSPTICYLTSPWLVGLSVLMPLCIIVLVNIVLFILTVRRIQQVVNLHARAESDIESSHQHVKACFRLSLLTGATWIISLAAEGLGLRWFRVISVVINGGQGVLLLLSYVTTRRVVSMMTDKLGCCQRGKEDSHTTATAMTNGSSGGGLSPSHSTKVTKVSATAESTT